MLLKNWGKAMGNKTWGEQVREHFPEADDQLVDFILWSLTCFPFDTESTLRQIRELAEEVKPMEEGWKVRLAEADRKIEVAMYWGSQSSPDAEPPVTPEIPGEGERA